MEIRAEVWAGLAALVVAALAGAAVAWGRWQRVRRVKAWVRGYLMDRYGAVPAGLDIDCSAAPLAPVQVTFVTPRTGARHHLHFACWGPRAYYLVAETDGDN